MGERNDWVGCCMNSDVFLKDAKKIFSDTVSELAKEHGMDFGMGYDKLMRLTVKECTDEYAIIWADFMQWFYYGENQKDKTMDVIRASLHAGMMWR